MAPVTFGCVGDVHEAFGHLEAALRWLAGRDLDALLLAGDFTRGLPPDAERPDADPLSPVRRGVERARATGLPVYFVPGNHDRPEAPLEGNVDRRRATVRGARLYGIGGSGPARMGFPYEWPDEEIARLEVPDRDVLLTHAPPADTGLDRTHSGRHVGSRAVRRLAARTRGALVCGHIHESAGTERLGDCLCYNAGSLGGVFGRLQAGVLRIDPSRGRSEVRHWVRADGRWTKAGEARVDAGPG